MARSAAKAFLQVAAAEAGCSHLLRPSGRLERDWLRRTGEPTRLCAARLRRTRPVGGQGGAMTEQPRATDGRAPDVFREGRWVPMRGYRDADEVDFAIVGTGAGGGTLACKLAEAGYSVVALDAGPYWRPLEDFASDEQHQAKLYWTDERIVDGDNPIQLGCNNSGQSVGGSTVHF